MNLRLTERVRDEDPSTPDSDDGEVMLVANELIGEAVIGLTYVPD